MFIYLMSGRKFQIEIFTNVSICPFCFHDMHWLDTKKPLFTSFQEEQKIMPLPANCPTLAVMDVAENIRAKIYAVLGKLGKKLLVKFSRASVLLSLQSDFALESIFKHDDQNPFIQTSACSIVTQCPWYTFINYTWS